MATGNLHNQPLGQADPSGARFFSSALKREMKYVYPDTKHWAAGWLLWKHPDGHWVTFRKATDADICELSTAVSLAHHTEGGE